MNILTKRLKLNGSIGDNAFKDGCGMLALPAAADVVLQMLLVEADGTVVDVTDLAVVTLEFYAAVGDENTLFDAVAVTEITECTVGSFDAGTGQHVEIPLTGADLNQLGTLKSGQFWVVVYGTFNESLNGARRTFAAGPVVLKNTGAGGAGPAETPDELYPTNAQMAALLAGAGVELIEPPLDGYDDTRGSLGARMYDPDLGRMYFKISSDPHQWLGWSVFNA